MTTDITTAPPRDLTPEEADERAQSCFAIDRQIKAAIGQGRAVLWETARLLHEFDEANGWTALGYEKLGDWLADPEIGMARSSYFRLVKTWREMVIQRKVPTERLERLDISKVEIVLPALKSGRAKLKTALNDVEGMGQRDLRETYMQRPDTNPGLPDVPRDSDRPHDAVPDDETFTVNDGTDALKRANDITREPQEDKHEDEAASPESSSPTVEDDVPPVIEGTAQIVDEEAPAPPLEAPPVYTGPTVQVALESAEIALAEPYRAPGNRKHVRDALLDLVSAVRSMPISAGPAVIRAHGIEDTVMWGPIMADMRQGLKIGARTQVKDAAEALVELADRLEA